jgi:hypothetical protein
VSALPATAKRIDITDQNLHTLDFDIHVILQFSCKRKTVPFVNSGRWYPSTKILSPKKRIPRRKVGSALIALPKFQ